MKGLPSFQGLFFPKEMKRLSQDFWGNIENLTFHQIAFEVLTSVSAFAISDEDLKCVIKEAFNFDVKLKKLSDNDFVLETFHGPTLTFKDFGARFLAQYLKVYTQGGYLKDM